MKPPLLSVIIPVYNGAEFLAEALATVRAQAYTPLEVIVIDDGSTDQTAQVIQTWGADLRYVYQQNQGPAAARNTGLTLAQGELIAFLDADDLWPTDKLTQQVAALTADATTGVVWGTTQISPYDAAERAFPPLAPKWLPLLGSMVCRQAIFHQAGLFEPTLRFGEDIDWLIRLHEQKVGMQKVPVPALIYRVRPGSMTYDKALTEVGWFDNIRRTLQRRRTAARGTAARELG
ncbi:MAG: glycosyltransferase family A protein [Caldilineaceae bacterium]